MRIRLFTSALLIGILTGCGTSGNGCCMTDTDEIDSGTLGSIAPIARISNINDKIFQVGEEITLDGFPSSDKDGNIIKYEWENGTLKEDGATHTVSFDTAGSKIVYLTVTDDDGLTNTTQATINIQDINTTPTTPVAVITQPDSERYTFSCTDSYDQDENGASIANCEWTTEGYGADGTLLKKNQGILDDHTVTIQPCGNAAYAIITLTVTDNENETNTISHRVDFH
jgi:hypothetical protein